MQTYNKGGCISLGNLQPKTADDSWGSWYNVGMQETPVASFMHFFLGFLVFISLSVGLTVFVNSYTIKQAGDQQAAAAKALMLEQY